MQHAPEDLWDEVAYLAYHLHWGLDVLFDLEHRDRKALIDNVGSLNERAWAEAKRHG